jgi:hypothetical protein
MMVLSGLRQDASLPEFLAYRARAASIRRLAADATVGVAVVVATVWWTPRGALLLAGVGLVFASYGAWGIADRARSGHMAASSDLWRQIINMLCALMVAVGATALAAILYSAWTTALGTWIS